MFGLRTPDIASRPPKERLKDKAKVSQEYIAAVEQELTELQASSQSRLNECRSLTAELLKNVG